MSESNFSRLTPNEGLTVDQRELIRRCLVARPTPYVTAEQRHAIIDICDQAGTVGQPEHLLIAFKSAVVEAANMVGMRPGSERSALLERLVSVFIEELYGRHLRPNEARASRTRDAALTSEAGHPSRT